MRTQRTQLPRLWGAQQISPVNMQQREPDQVERLRNIEESNVGQIGKQEGQRPSGPSCSPWADSEIRIFLEEWERVERRVGNPGRKISEKSLALSLQLNERRGLKKNWESCVLLMRTLQNLHRRLCSGRPETVPLFSPYSEALYRILGRPPDCSCSPWVDYEIRIFLQEWEGVERRDGSPGKQALEKSWALYKRLNEQRGLKKSWDSCFHLLLTLQNLHRTLCNERPETVPLFSPYSEALYRILGRPPGPLCRDGSGIRLPAKNPQPSMNRPLDSGTTVPLTQLQGNPLLMKSQRNSLFPRRDTLKHSHPSPFPRLPPACDPGDSHVRQQPWSNAD